MQHHFDVEIAQEHGLDLAVLIHHFQFWIGKNAANNRNLFEGRYWTHNTQEALEIIFPYWSRSQIKRKLKKLEDEKLFVTGFFNKSGFDRTKWYAFSDKLLEKFPHLVGPCVSSSDESVPSKGQDRPNEETKPSVPSDDSVPSEETIPSLPTDDSVPSLSYSDPDSDPDGDPDSDLNSASGDAVPSPPADEDKFFLTRKKRKLKGKRLETFERFWNCFDLKKGKAEAADAWMDIPELYDSTVDIICKAAEIEAAGRAELIAKGMTPKWAQGWISGRRWEDEDLLEPAQPALPYLDRITGLVREHGWEAFDSACQHFRISDPDQYRLAVEKGLETV